MTRQLTPETVAIVKATGPALQRHGVAITTRMYERLFVDEDIRAMFDQAAQESIVAAMAWSATSSFSQRRGSRFCRIGGNARHMG